MDRRTIIGFALMGLVLVVFTWLGRPTKEQIAEQQRINDSLALVEEARVAEEAKALELREQQGTRSQISEEALAQIAPELRDSIRQAEQKQLFGEMSRATEGEERLLTLENDSVRYTFSTKGGMLVGSELKEYQDYQGEPIKLLRPEDMRMAMHFVTRSNRVISSSELYFEGRQLADDQLMMTTTSDTGQKLSFVFTLRDKYMLQMQVVSEGFHNVLASNAPYLDIEFFTPIYQNEKSLKSEQRYSGIAYEMSDGKVDKMSTSKADSEELGGTARWFAFRDMFFNTFVYSPQGLRSLSLNSELASDEGLVKHMGAKFTLDLTEKKDNAPITLMFYTGPNDYPLLKSIDHLLGADTSLSKIVEMGGWFRFINIWVILPVFNFLEHFISNYGLIIFLLTLFIKLILMPFTLKSYKSQAKMRVLRPQIEAINEKYPGEENMMKRQQETMNLYRNAGVNTMGGCLPMLLQMPILVAMYQYFPTSINLRGESFLWAQDLSTYDDVIRFGFDIPFIGSHISLFCLLMTITQVVYMRITQMNSGQPQMAMMKWMPVIMAVMLFTFLNQNAAALSYYYLLSMLITILQTQFFKWTLDEKKILAQLEANKKKPKKKSKFMERLEAAQKEQERLMREQQRK